MPLALSAEPLVLGIEPLSVSVETAAGVVGVLLTGFAAWGAEGLGVEDGSRT